MPSPTLPSWADAAKRAAGLSTERDAPRFAARTFRDWFEKRPARLAAGGERILLWPDTFTNYFEPRVARAAVEVLEAAGCRAELPGRPLCCGRPLYDYGMLPLAKRFLRRILDELTEPISAGVPIVGLEPSCVAVFRDELPNLFPDDHQARRLAAQSRTFAEQLARLDWQLPRLGRRALYHGHCHQKAVMGTAADDEILERLGLEVERPDSGCCGLAGSFGYEDGEPYEVSIKAGERVLLPAVREAAPDALVIADGFSCRTQIEHGTSRRPLHLAQVLRMALDCQAEQRPQADTERAAPVRRRPARVAG
jgi:Fe-S oxidoreductase